MSEFDYYSTRAMGVRLKDKHLMYFLKFAQENGTKDVTDTMRAIIARLSDYESLDDVEFTETGFNGKRGAKAKEQFLEKKKDEELKKEITFGELVKKPEPEPEELEEPEQEEPDEDDNEEVFTL